MTISITDQTVVKRIVAACNNEIWYGDMTTFSELAAATGNIDTSDQLILFEAFQKVFVVNGSNLNVIDFINTKLTSNAQITSNVPAKGDVLSQAGDDPAAMVVDYIYYDSGAGKHYVYGYTYDGTFDTTHNVTDANSNVIITSANLSAVDEASTTPHWYDWTPYNNDTTTYGSLPTTAYLGCLWRGRGVLAGNPTYPYQWYMSRQGNLFDWEYTATDAQSPISGNDANLGLIGDVIRALVPYNDDLLIIGCANSIYLFEGDPAENGSLAELDVTTGMFGAKSWCFDSDGKLYFLGAGGLYVLPDITQRKVYPLTSISMPDFYSDEDLDPTTHRVTLVFDRDNQGILVCVTKISDGSNSNYFYSLKTGGFFPETYPEECGVYSAMFYDANDPDERGVLLGTADGYLRTFDRTAKNDDIGTTDEAISSYVTIPILIQGDSQEDFDAENKLRALRFEASGGASSGTYTDFDGFAYSVYASSDSETCLEDILDGATAKSTGTITSGGLSNRKRARARGTAIMLYLYNSTASQTWAVNRIYADMEFGGRS